MQKRRFSARGILLAVILFLALSLANLIYFKARLAIVNNPYGSSGSVLGNIVSAAATGNRADRERTRFVTREVAALVVSIGVLLVFSGKPGES